jgi:hypothetical protein
MIIHVFLLQINSRIKSNNTSNLSLSINNRVNNLLIIRYSKIK